MSTFKIRTMKYINLIFIGLCFQVNAQDPVYTNTQQSLVALNPSFAGSNGLFRYQSTTRSQWYNLSGSYLTYYNSVDAYIKPTKGGIALSYTRDDQAKGTLVTDRIDLTYAQHFSFINKKLKVIPSIQFSGFRKTLDHSKLNYGDQIDARRGFAWSQVPHTGKVSKINGDLSAGLIVNYKHFYVGSSFFHITEPDEGILGPSKLPYRFSAFSSYNLFFGEKLLINAMFRFEKQQNFIGTNIRLNSLYAKHLMLSIGLQNNNTINTLIGYRHNYFTISGGYEFGISRINFSTAGSFEICASFNLRNKDERHAVNDMERW